MTAHRPPRAATALPNLPALPTPSVPLSLALDPLPEPRSHKTDSLTDLPSFLRKNRFRTSLPASPKLSDAEALKAVYRSDPRVVPMFAASMTHLPRVSRESAQPDFDSPRSDPREWNGDGERDWDGGDSPIPPSRSGSGSTSNTNTTNYEEPRRYEPLRASSAAHARVQRKLAAKNGAAAAASTLSLGVVPEFEQERNHRVFANSKVGRWVRSLVQRR